MTICDFCYHRGKTVPYVTGATVYVTIQVGYTNREETSGFSLCQACYDKAKERAKDAVALAVGFIEEVGE
jgi:hypothetical protein